VEQRIQPLGWPLRIFAGLQRIQERPRQEQPRWGSGGFTAPAFRRKLAGQLPVRLHKGRIHVVGHLTTRRSGSFSGSFREPHRGVWTAVFAGATNQFATQETTRSAR
jgi:hypothetical protein